MTYAIASNIVKKTLSKPLALFSSNTCINNSSSRSIIKSTSKRLTTNSFINKNGISIRPISSHSNNQSSSSPSSSSSTFPLLAAAMMMTSASTIWWDQQTNCSVDNDSLHPSPTPSSVGSEENFQVETKSMDDLNLPVFSR